MPYENRSTELPCTVGSDASSTPPAASRASTWRATTKPLGMRTHHVRSCAYNDDAHDGADRLLHSGREPAAAGVARTKAHSGTAPHQRLDIAGGHLDEWLLVAAALNKHVVIRRDNNADAAVAEKANQPRARARHSVVDDECARRLVDDGAAGEAGELQAAPVAHRAAALVTVDVRHDALERHEAAIGE
jgi:hypothetical protein